MPEVLSLRGSFPVSREERFLTRVNRLEDATEYRLAEQLSPLYRWEVELRGQSTAQVQELENTFASLAGRYGNFVFLDPLENLLRWSEDFGQAAWEKAQPAQLAITYSLPDPLAGNAAQELVNTASAVNTVTQWLAAPPAGLELTASLWARAAAPLAITLALTDGAGETYSSSLSAGAAWQRFWLTASFSPSSAGQQVGFRIELPASSTVRVFGAQLMPLGAPAAYVRTTTVSGFHPKCRFGSDVLFTRLEGEGTADVRLTIVEFA